MIRANWPKFSVFTPFGVKVTHVNAAANRALTPGKLRRAGGGNIDYFTGCEGYIVFVSIVVVSDIPVSRTDKCYRYAVQSLDSVPITFISTNVVLSGLQIKHNIDGDRYEGSR